MLIDCGFWGDFWNVVNSEIKEKMIFSMVKIYVYADVLAVRLLKRVLERIDAQMKSIVNYLIILIAQVLQLNCIKHNQSRNLKMLLNFKT